MNYLQLFNFEGKKVRTLKVNDEPYFVGKDVATILGYSDTNQAIRNHVDDEDKLTRKFNGSGQNRSMTIINESGLYSLILSSKMPNAKRFKRWVTSEVLPAIRKHGAYMTDEKAFDVVNNKNGLADLLQQAADQLRQKDIKIAETESKNKKLQEKIDKDADDVVFAKAIRYSHHAISVKELAEILTQNGFQIGQNQLFELLRKTKYLSKQKSAWNLPMGSKIKAGYFRIKHGIAHATGRAYTQTLVTPKGQKHIINKALKGEFDDSYQNVIVSTFGI